MRYLFWIALCGAVMLAGCWRETLLTSCQETSDCPTGYHCDTNDHLCMADSDSGVLDASHVDVAQVDTHLFDTCMPDTRIPDAGLPDTQLPDTRVPDTRVPDTRLPDTRAPDTAPVCEGVWCDHVCYAGGRCCENSDCTYPGAVCDPSHQCTVEIVLQQGLNGYDGCIATYLDTWNPDTAQVNPGVLWVRSDEGASDLHSGLIRFNLQGIPIAAKVAEATLSLYDSGFTSECWIDVGLFRVLTTWNSTAATWRSRFSGIPWAAPGCNGIGSDRSGTSSVSGRLAASGQWYHFEVTTDVKAWVETPANNRGFLIKGFGSMCSTGHTVISPYHGNPVPRPKLRVVYREP